jgi:hypothetical protein
LNVLFQLKVQSGSVHYFIGIVYLAVVVLVNVLSGERVAVVVINLFINHECVYGLAYDEVAQRRADT